MSDGGNFRSDTPWRHQFDNARDPYTARNALGITTIASGAPINAQYITAAADPTLTAERVLTNTATVTWDFATAGQAKATATGFGNVSNSGTPTAGQIAQWTDATHIQGIAAPFGPPQGRLTLQIGTPVMTSTQASQAVIYYEPYIGDKVPIYNGTSWVMTQLQSAGGGISISTTDTTRNPSAIGASKVNDWFVWDGGAGFLYLSHGPDWTNDITRSAGTALVRVNGIWLNNVTIGNGTTTGPAAQRGTYVGTTRSNASSQLDWIYGTSATGGGAAFFGVWNCYNRVNVGTSVIEATLNWTVPSGIRAFNNSNSNRVSAVFGLAEDAIAAVMRSTGASTTSNSLAVGVGLDSTSAISGSFSGSFNTTTSVYGSLSGEFSSTALGFHFWQAMEAASAAGGVGTGTSATNQWTAALAFYARM